MPKHRYRSEAAAVALATFVAAFANVPVASAQAKKMTYEQAFAKCKQELDARGLVGANTSVAERSSAGGACMKKYGFRLKKGSI